MNFEEIVCIYGHFLRFFISQNMYLRLSFRYMVLFANDETSVLFSYYFYC